MIHGKNCSKKSKRFEEEHEMQRRVFAMMAIAVLAIGIMGCGKSTPGQFKTEKEITVVSREDGSGTRGAFIELFGIEVKDAEGNKQDQTTEEANITNSTSVMMTSVSGNEYAIGYISLGSMNDTVKAVKINGSIASIENVKNGTYTIARPFNIVTKSVVSEATQDFIQYIMSTEGQKIVEDSGYVPLDTTTSYENNGSSGKIVVAGSSSVSPVVEKLKEAYLKVQSNNDVEIQTSDSTTGVSATSEGIADIGMISREIKDSEVESGLQSLTIALDGIVVIVNHENPVEELSSSDVYDIYTGKTITWESYVQ